LQVAAPKLTEGLADQVPLNVHQNSLAVWFVVLTAAAVVHVCPPAWLTVSVALAARC
jgi:hypothetical protein